MPDTRALVEYLRERVDQSGKNQTQIAAEAGIGSRQAVSMILSGAMKLPIRRVQSMAQAIGADETVLFRLVLAQLVGVDEASAMIAMARKTALTGNQRRIIEELRSASGFEDPPLDERLKAAIQSAYDHD